LSATKSRTAAATEARQKRSAFKRAVKAGQIAPNRALRHRLAQRMRVIDLMAALPYNANSRAVTLRPATIAAAKVCVRAGVQPLQLVGELENRQRILLVTAYHSYRKGSLKP